MHIPMIRNDTRGFGYMGAPRGDRFHNGIDLVCEPGHAVYAFNDGIVTKLGYCYNDDPSYRYVQITDSDNKDPRYFYVTPFVGEGESIEAGQFIGLAQDIAKRYEDPEKHPMENHIHFEVMSQGVYLDPNLYLAIL